MMREQGAARTDLEISSAQVRGSFHGHGGGAPEAWDKWPLSTTPISIRSPVDRCGRTDGQMYATANANAKRSLPPPLIYGMRADMHMACMQACVQT